MECIRSKLSYQLIISNVISIMENGNESQHLQSSPTSNLPQLRRCMYTPSNWCEQKRLSRVFFAVCRQSLLVQTTWTTVLLYAQHEYPLESTQDTRTCCCHRIYTPRMQLVSGLPWWWFVPHPREPLHVFREEKKTRGRSEIYRLDGEHEAKRLLIYLPTLPNSYII